MFSAISVILKIIMIRKFLIGFTKIIEKYSVVLLDGYEVEKEKRYFVKIKGNIKENICWVMELF